MPPKKSNSGPKAKAASAATRAAKTTAATRAAQVDVVLTRRRGRPPRQTTTPPPASDSESESESDDEPPPPPPRLTAAQKAAATRERKRVEKEAREKEARKVARAARKEAERREAERAAAAANEDLESDEDSDEDDDDDEMIGGRNRDKQPSRMDRMEEMMKNLVSVVAQQGGNQFGGNGQVAFAPGTSLSEQFPWVKEDILERARTGMLGPEDLPKLADPTSKVANAPEPESNNLGFVVGPNNTLTLAPAPSANSSTIFFKSFKTLLSFSHVWQIYLACLLQSSHSLIWSYRLHHAFAWHFDKLSEWAAKYKTSAVLAYHFDVHRKRFAKGPFNPDLWIKQIDQLSINSNLTMLKRRQASTFNSSAGPSNSRARQLSVTSDSSSEVCTLFQTGRCTKGHCKFGRQHKCSQCGGSHPSSDCKGKKKVTFGQNERRGN